MLLIKEKLLYAFEFVYLWLLLAPLLLFVDEMQDHSQGKLDS